MSRISRNALARAITTAKELLACVQVETANWLNRIVPEETDKYVMMAAANFVNCIAFVPMKAPKSAPCRRQTG